MRLIADYRGPAVAASLIFGLAGCVAQHATVAKTDAVVTPAPPPPPDLNALYDRAIMDAAVKRPSFIVDLTPINGGRPDVELVTLHRRDDQPVNARNQTIAQPTWTALPGELGPKCRARHGDAVLALEEILGMPPDTTPDMWQMTLFTVSPKRVFRPCASSPDITTNRCSLDIARANGSQADFLYHQTWSSYQIGTDKIGYPFTGMGWTYDWSPDASSHVGVSEYVVRAGTRASKVEALTPENFCRGQEVTSVTSSPGSAPSTPPAP